mgnify:CR=1 FL=1
MNLEEAILQELAKVSPELTRLINAPAVIRSAGGEYEVRAHLDLYYPVASFTMKNSLQCNAIAVPYRVRVEPQYRRRGIGKILEGVRINAARAAGYKLLLATSRADNETQIRIMQETGWKQMHAFHNDNSGHDVILWMLVL